MVRGEKALAKEMTCQEQPLVKEKPLVKKNLLVKENQPAKEKNHPSTLKTIRQRKKTTGQVNTSRTAIQTYYAHDNTLSWQEACRGWSCTRRATPA
jgi:hypothetical protein